MHFTFLLAISFNLVVWYLPIKTDNMEFDLDFVNPEEDFDETEERGLVKRHCRVTKSLVFEFISVQLLEATCFHISIYNLHTTIRLENMEKMTTDNKYLKQTRFKSGSGLNLCFN